MLTPQRVVFFEWEDVLYTEPVCLFLVVLETLACHVWHVIPSDPVLLREALIFVECKSVADVVEIIWPFNDSGMREIAPVLFSDVLI